LGSPALRVLIKGVLSEKDDLESFWGLVKNKEACKIREKKSMRRITYPGFVSRGWLWESAWKAKVRRRTVRVAAIELTVEARGTKRLESNINIGTKFSVVPLTSPWLLWAEMLSLWINLVWERTSTYDSGASTLQCMESSLRWRHK